MSFGSLVNILLRILAVVLGDRRLRGARDVVGSLPDGDEVRPRGHSGRPVVRFDDCIVSGVPKNINPQSLSIPARPVPEL